MKKIRVVALKILIALCLCYMVFVAWLYLYQEKLTFPVKTLTEAQAREAEAKTPGAERINLTANDGVIISGWFVKSSTQAHAPLLIYFGGNAEEVSSMLGRAKWFDGLDVVLMNYRGYGLSGGKPSEKNQFKDSLAIYDHFTKNLSSGTPVVVMGRSLGTGVAVYLARHRPARGIILASPYDSIASVGQEQYPLAPIRLILKNKFDSLSLAPNINIPMLALLAENDTTIKISHSQKLIGNWGGTTTVVLIKEVDHNSMLDSSIYWKSINEFIHKLFVEMSPARI